MIAEAIRHLAEYVSYRAVASLVRRLPHGAVRLWGRSLGHLAYGLLGRRRRLTLANLERALPQLSPLERRRTARSCFAEHAAFFVEALWASRIDPPKVLERFEIEGEEHLEAARSLGRGLFVLTGHYGYWELAAYPLGALVGKLHILVRPQTNPHIRRDLEPLRERMGHVLIPRRKGGHRMLNVLRRGGTVALAIDQRVRPSEGVLVPFLGRYAWTSPVPAFLATVTGAPAVPIFCVPIAGGRYRLSVHAPVLPKQKGEEEVVRLTRSYLRPLEREIRRRPEHWFWPHSRWQRAARYRWPEAIERLRTTSGLPSEEVEPAELPPGCREAVRRLETLVDDDFLEQARHLHLVGEATSCAPVATAIGHHIVGTGHPTLYTSAEELLARLDSHPGRETTDAALRQLDSVALVLVDRADPRQLAAAELDRMARFLGHRRLRGSVLLSSPLDTREWLRELARASPGAREAFLLFSERCQTLRLQSPRGRPESTMHIPAAQSPL